MKFAEQKSHDRRLLSIELTPMIDVVFLLIIFFMTTAQFAKMTRADLELPRERGEQEDAPEEAGLIINITREGEIIINEQTVTLDGLAGVISNAVQAQPEQDPGRVRLMIRADRSADTAVLNDVLSHLQKSGIGLTRLATEVP